MDVSIYRLRTRDVLTLCVMALLMLGVVMVQSASAGAVQSSAWQWTANAIKDAIFAIAGLATFLIVGCFNYAWLGRATKTLRRNPIIWLLVITALANLLVLVPHIGISVNGRGDGCGWDRCKFSRRNWPSGRWCCTWPIAWRGGH